jgi:hypothetical protein
MMLTAPLTTCETSGSIIPAFLLRICYVLIPFSDHVAKSARAGLIGEPRAHAVRTIEHTDDSSCRISRPRSFTTGAHSVRRKTGKDLGRQGSSDVPLSGSGNDDSHNQTHINTCVRQRPRLFVDAQSLHSSAVSPAAAARLFWGLFVRKHECPLLRFGAPMGER